MGRFATRLGSEVLRMRKCAGFAALTFCVLPGFLLSQETDPAANGGAPSAGALPAGATSGEMESRARIVEMQAATGGVDYQISVHGENPTVRVTFKSYANELRKDFRWSICKYRPGEKSTARNFWAIPIRIELKGRVEDVYKGVDTATQVKILMDGRLYLFVHVRLHDNFEESSFREEMIRALVIEQMLMPVAQNPSALAEGDFEPPAWIVHGFDQLLEHRDAGSPSSFYQGALRSGQILKPDEIFSLKNPDQLDSLSYTVFRASAAAMVETLLDQPQGDIGLREVLGDLGTKPGVAVAPLMRQHFPAFREMEQGMEKWWALQVAALGQQQSFEFMDWEETERWLNEALTIRIDTQNPLPVPEPKKKGLFQKLKHKAEEKKEPIPPFTGMIDQWKEFIGRKEAEMELARCFSRIQQLKQTGFPLYRPVFDGYEGVIERLIQKRTKDIDARLAALEEMRTAVYETLVRTEDYMNFYAATRAPQRSQAFDDYMKLRKELNEKPLPKRDDRITRYLDALEMEFR